MSSHDIEDGAALLPERLRGWLVEHAEVLDRDASLAEALLPQLASAELFGIGVSAGESGVGGDIGNAIDAVSAVAEHSLTAAFVFWAQRSFIEYLLASPNESLRRRALTALVRGRLAGASGLSNAMKFLAGVESLQIEARDEPGGWRLEGRMPWVTNLRQPDYLVAAAVSRAAGGPPAVVALPGERTGMARSADLDLLGLRGSNTAAIQVGAVRIGDEDILHLNGPAFLRAVRPSFLGLQCGMSIGLARSALGAAQAACRGDRGLLQPRIDTAREALERITAALKEGVRDGRFVERAAPLFELRIGLSQIVQEAVQLELQASGGRAYLLQPASGFGRRLREAAFIPVVTPSVTQLQGELQKLHSLVHE
jgi:alkylation response protein AidB-like acyl-CoA dehydrogenase